jgi:hypothetical protein
MISPLDRQLALEFEAAMEAGREEVVQQFLAAHTHVLERLIPISAVWPKYRLGTEFVTDFLIVGGANTNDPRPHVALVEIERADARLFTKKGDPCAELTHAVRQIQDWRAWITAHRAYLASQLRDRWSAETAGEDQDGREIALQQRLMEHFAVRLFVIIGRRSSMGVGERLRLAQMNDDLPGITILTYDVLLDWLLSGHWKDVQF